MKYLSKRPHTVNGGLFEFPATVDDLFQRFWGVPARAEPAAWQPPVDIVETPEAYVLKLEIPGIPIEGVDITVTGDTLVLRGEKPIEERLEGEAQRMRERTFGAFERTFTFPTAIAAQAIEAKARNGVLTISVRKAEEARPHKIVIQGGD